MSNVLNLTSERAVRQASNLAKRMQAECGNEVMDVVGAAVMALLRTLPMEMQAHICGVVSQMLIVDGWANAGATVTNGNDSSKNAG